MSGKIRLHFLMKTKDVIATAVGQADTMALR